MQDRLQFLVCNKEARIHRDLDFVCILLKLLIAVSTPNNQRQLHHNMLVYNHLHVDALHNSRKRLFQVGTTNSLLFEMYSMEDCIHLSLAQFHSKLLQLLLASMKDIARYYLYSKAVYIHYKTSFERKNRLLKFLKCMPDKTRFQFYSIHLMLAQYLILPLKELLRCSESIHQRKLVF